MRRWGWVLLVVVLLGCRRAEPEEVATLKIAVMAPFSGDYAALGNSVRDAVVLAAETWNERGGVAGLPIELVLEDSGCDYLQGRAAAQAGLEKGAAFVVGAVCATASEGVAQIVTSASDAGALGGAGLLGGGDTALGALQISPASVDSGLTLDAEGAVRSQVFRMPLTDEAQGIVAARYAREQIGAARAAVLYDDASSYGATLATSFSAAFTALGGEIVATETYDRGALDFYEELGAVRDETPDMVYMPGYAALANTLVSQARSFGLLAPVMGSDGWHSSSLDLAAMEGASFTTHYYKDEPSRALRDWQTRYEDRYLVEPDGLAVLSYDAADLLLTAISETGVSDPLLVARTLEALTYEGLSGTMAFDAQHDPVKSMVVLRVEGGQMRYDGRFDATDPEVPE